MSDFVPYLERDYQILNAICEYGGLTALQISQLYFPLTYLKGKPYPQANCQVRLKELAKGECIVGTDKYRLNPIGNNPLVYTLTTKGRTVLARWLGKKVKEMASQEGDSRVDTASIPHLLRCNDVRIAFTRAVMDRGDTMSLGDWHDDLELKRRHSKDKMTITIPPDREESGVIIVPDGYFQLDVESPMPKAYHRFLEIDRGTEIGRSKSGYDDWVRKIQKYRVYTMRDGLYWKRYPDATNVAMLIITNSHKRMANLKSITESLGGKHRFWFTTFDHVSPTSVLTEPIWEIATKEGKHTFLLPTEENV